MAGDGVVTYAKLVREEQRSYVRFFEASDLDDPALGSLNSPHLDTAQRVVQLLRNRTHLFHAVNDLFAVIHDLANGRDHCSSAAKAAMHRPISRDRKNLGRMKYR